MMLSFSVVFLLAVAWGLLWVGVGKRGVLFVFYPFCDVGEDFGGNGFFDLVVFVWHAGGAMLEEVVEGWVGFGGE